MRKRGAGCTAPGPLFARLSAGRGAGGEGLFLAALLTVSLTHSALAQPPTREETLAALKESVTFFREQASTGGGYVWRYTGDLKLSEGEGKTTGTSLIWVQPPGTPTVGMEFLEAYAATQDEYYLDAARDAGVGEGVMDAHDLKPDSGIISSATLVRNVTRLARSLEPGGADPQGFSDGD